MTNRSLLRPAVTWKAFRSLGFVGVFLGSFLLLPSAASAQYADGQTSDRGAIDDGRPSSENFGYCSATGLGSGGNAGSSTNSGLGSGGNAGSSTNSGGGPAVTAEGCADPSQDPLLQERRSVKPVNLPAARLPESKTFRSSSATGQSLPVTGGDVLSLTAMGAAAFLGGSLLVRSSRRRRDPAA